MSDSSPDNSFSESKHSSDRYEKKVTELNESEARYHKMIAEVQDYAIILLDISGNILNWNVGAERIKGYSAEEIIGSNFRIFYPRDDQQDHLPETLLRKAASEGRATHEGWRVKKNGGRFWGSIVITALHDAQGELIGFSKVTRDLTERKIAEDRMVATLRDLEIRNKELEQFAYVTSHDLQEPLRKIRTFLSIMGRSINDEKALKMYLDKIAVSSQRMTELILSILNYSRLTKEDEIPAQCDLNVVLKDVQEDLELLIQEKKAIITTETLPTIYGNPSQLNQLFLNLIANGIKFTRQEPIINIRYRRVSESEAANAPSHIKEGKYHEISFADNGIGFEQQYQDKIFSIFSRLNNKDEFPGTGIGLALCQKIMNLHNGYITATSLEGQGATFYVYFPS